MSTLIRSLDYIDLTHKHVRKGEGVPTDTPSSKDPIFYIDSTTGNAFTWTGAVWEPINDITINSGIPSGDPETGPIVYVDTATGQLYVWDGTAWVAGGTLIAVTNNNDGTYTVSDGTGNTFIIDTRASSNPIIEIPNLDFEGAPAENVQEALEGLQDYINVLNNLAHNPVTLNSSSSSALSIAGQELNLNESTLEINLDLDDLKDLTGVPEGSVNLGIWTTSGILTDNITIKEAFEELLISTERPLTFENGLTRAGDTISLEGPLVKDTNITDIGNYIFQVEDVKQARLISLYTDLGATAPDDTSHAELDLNAQVGEATLSFENIFGSVSQVTASSYKVTQTARNRNLFYDGNRLGIQHAISDQDGSNALANYVLYTAKDYNTVLSPFFILEDGTEINLNRIWEDTLFNITVDNGLTHVEAGSLKLGGAITGDTTLSTATNFLAFQDDRAGAAKQGIQYTGFSEASINDATGANYSSLVGTSLTPKKYVDDTALAVANAQIAALEQSFTAGSVIFSDGNNFAEDNANFFWDDSTNNLSIGNTAGGKLSVKGADDLDTTIVSEFTGNTAPGWSFRANGDIYFNNQFFMRTELGITPKLYIGGLPSNTPNTSVYIAPGSNTPGGDESVVIGVDAKSNQPNSVAIGKSAFAGASDVVIGSNATVNPGPTSLARNIGIGDSVALTGSSLQGNISIGFATRITNVSSPALNNLLISSSHTAAVRLNNTVSNIVMASNTTTTTEWSFNNLFAIAPNLTTGGQPKFIIDDTTNIILNGGSAAASNDTEVQALYDSSSTNSIYIPIGTNPSTGVLDSFSLYAKNYQSIDGQASPYALTEDNVEIDFRRADLVKKEFEFHPSVETEKITEIAEGQTITDVFYDTATFTAVSYAYRLNSAIASNNTAWTTVADLAALNSAIATLTTGAKMQVRVSVTFSAGWNTANVVGFLTMRHLPR